MDISEGLKTVVEGNDLTEEQAKSCMDSIMGGEATPAQIGAFLVALRMKGETIEEITGCVRTMREKATQVKVDLGENVIDTCGTGGDKSGTINISTLSAIVAAGAGVKVAKHGNRSVSSLCGSADLLEALGVNISLTPEQVAECISKAGIGFMFAPGFHSAMKHAIGPRKEMKIRTIFNILGPLTNPAGVKRQIMGVFAKDLVEPIAHVMKNLGAEQAMVLHGDSGLDEISITGPTFVAHVSGGKVTTEEVSPEDLGIKLSSLEEIQCEDVDQNKEAALEILTGETTGAKRDVVLLNSAAAVIVGGKAETFEQGISAAAESIDSGKAKEALDSFIEISNSFKE
jgi:anthranilate phosphoribosyltransferase